MSDPRLDFLDRLEAATKARMQAVDRVAATISEITGEATSPDRLVTVRVATSGALLGLALDDDALDLDARELAALVLSTARTATERAAAAVRQTVSPLEAPLAVGTDEPAVSPPGETSGQERAFDHALDRADHVADSVEERLRARDTDGR